MYTYKTYTKLSTKEQSHLCSFMIYDLFVTSLFLGANGPLGPETEIQRETERDRERQRKTERET